MKSNIQNRNNVIANEIANVLIKEYNKMLVNNWEVMYIEEDRLAYYYNKYEDIITNDEKVNNDVVWLSDELEDGNVTDNTKAHCVLAFARNYITMEYSDKERLFSFHSEYNRFELENPLYTDKEGYNYITTGFVDIEDYREDYEEYLDLYDENREEYTIEEYAKNSGYIPMQERIMDYIYTEL